ncbi:M14 family zinc carboxypeptidase [Halalkalicoccus jeotgali]|uniref:Peptidase M14 carboxypeptidase A n=1 Tax=Halalkalicoccus jeotgali (strain DSM 18796 / CECT 7217 / JCM 14584 / KCTC 4019 / B3) TaxID=795797 RepID=D8JAL3_HALJB|nr:M14 family zinc carboxypeptidase [Halalkalicoccus jeotgali]ADJ14735.1 peptidase M14 carboxypeptidase A [Halalkalicoccus jeotgali B3]ELY39317.1 peptidase M14 carboxypeptidase A [Halalkalicoccus jeotgali B3]
MTAGALALPGSAHSDHTSEKTGDLYEFVRNHTPEEYRIPTLIRIDDGSAFEALSALDGIEAYRETREPEPAAYGRLDGAAVATVLDVGGVSELEYAPGANPFWKLGVFPSRVFPAVEDSVGYIGFEECEAGLAALAEAHPERLALTSVGESPGHRDLFEGDTDPKDLWVAELTNDVGNDSSFEEKDKLVYTLSIHGDERVGVEAGSRFIERVLAGEEPAVEDRLDDAVLVFLYANPDGWVAREPRYPSPDDGFERVSATGVDPNRQYPTAGRIDPVHYPADPDGADLIDDAPGVDGDIPERVAEHAPDALSIARHMRGYENVELFCDLHGMHWSEQFVVSLVANAQYDHRRLAEMDLLNRAIGAELEAEIGSLEENREALSIGAERYDPVREEGGEVPDAEAMVPESLYDFGTVYDTLGYSTTGALLGWAAHPEEAGGLGAKSIALEMAFSNTISPMRLEYSPELLDVQVGAYLGALRAASREAPADRDPSISGEGSTAVVTTDDLARSSDALSFVGARSEETRTTAEIDPRGDETVTFGVSAPTDEISLRLRADGTEPLHATVFGPDGAERHAFDGTSTTSGRDPSWTVADPAVGQWRVAISNPRSVRAEVAVLVDAVVSDASADPPDPRDVLGYEQRLYETNPLSYFESYAEFAEGSVEFVSPAEVASGVLTDGDRPVYDAVVLIHDSFEAPEAIDEYVEAGGSLVLTDSGVELLCDLHAGSLSVIGSRAITTGRREFAALDEYRASEHPLLAETRGIERELWTLAPKGYAIGEEAPVTSVVPEVFEAAGGSVAATIGGGVAVGSIGNVHVIGSLLPPSSQAHLHPFGLLDHSVSMLGHTILSNALGYAVGRGENEPLF